mmetsp:Transcript_22812/g.33687  ORF Transcript_22812/g.33687 Transcript_22812/m.33687 type:complete len:417 (-) Transcript_22812:1853-3103(-)
MISYENLLLYVVLLLFFLPQLESFVSSSRRQMTIAKGFMNYLSEAEENTVVKEMKSNTTIHLRPRRKWDHMFSRLTEFYEKNGHSLVSMRDDQELAKWCSSIRAYRRNGARFFTQEELQGLADVDFVWDVQSFKWNEKFEELCTYQSINGHCCVPPSHPTLGAWVLNQKTRYRELVKGKSLDMTPERVEALTAIGFWESFQTNSNRWNQRLRELKEFYHNFGHSNVPADYAENYQLGQWVMNQRDHFKRYIAGLSSPLSPRHIASLESLDFQWNRHSHDWYQMCERLKEFSHKHGHVQIPIADTENYDLRCWLNNQRYQHQRKLENRTSSMSDERQRVLEQIPHLEWKEKATVTDKPSSRDWIQLFDGLRNESNVPGAKITDFWYDGEKNLNEDIDDLEEKDVMDLWNQEDDDEIF